jgi:hypothetical protein
MAAGREHEADDADGSGAGAAWRVRPLGARRGEPRQFVVWWSAYLLVSSILAMGGMGFIGLAGYEVFRPAVQILLTMTAVGLAVLWPMVRRRSGAAGQDPSRRFGSMPWRCSFRGWPCWRRSACRGWPVGRRRWG